MRTQVAIVGAGPAGLTLARLLEREGIESVVLEDRSRDYVEHRIRAGVLEQGTTDLLVEAGVGERMQREGIVHHGIELQFDGERHRIPLSELTGGRTIMIYGQTEVVKDLIAARLDAGLPLLFEVSDVTVHELESTRPKVRFRHEGRRPRARVRRRSRAVTATTGSAVRAFRPACSARARATILSAGSGSSRRFLPRTTSSCTRTTRGASHC